MSAIVHRHIARSKLGSLLPQHNYRALAERSGLPEPYTVVVFSERMVRVGALRRLLRKLRVLDGETLIVAAQRFTRECEETARQFGAHLIGNHYFWSEESYEQIHTSMASRKKFPPKRKGDV